MKAEIGVYPKDRQVLYKILPLDTPLVVDLHVTHYCNFRCRYCAFSQTDEALSSTVFKRGTMSWEMFSLVVEQLKEFPSRIKMVTIAGAEATILPRLADMIKLLRDADVTDKIQILTNGSLLTHELSDKLVAAGLGELRISLQGLSADKYSDVSKVKINWDEFYENICYFSKIRGNCALKVKIADIALEPGDEDTFYSLFGDICDAVAVEHIYEAFAVNDAPLDYGIIDSGQKTRYGREFRDIMVCRKIFTSCDVMPDGMFLQNCHVPFGHEKSIRESSLLEQWNSVAQNQLRLKMLESGRKQFPHCAECTILSNTWHPEDVLDGHEAEILERMKQKYGL